MRSLSYFRLVVLLVLPIVAGVLVATRDGESDSASSNQTSAVRAATDNNIRGVSEAERSGVRPRQEPATDPQVPPARALTAAGEKPDYHGKFASAVAAAERGGMLNQTAAQSADAQQARDLLNKLAEDQARKESFQMSVISPFGSARQVDQAK